MKANHVFGLVLVVPVLFAACNSDSTTRKEKTAAQSAAAAQQVYVPPGKLDEYYAILSGGQSGSVFVYGIASCRFIKEISLFEPRAGPGAAAKHPPAEL